MLCVSHTFFFKIRSTLVSSPNLDNKRSSIFIRKLQRIVGIVSVVVVSLFWIYNFSCNLAKNYKDINNIIVGKMYVWTVSLFLFPIPRILFVVFLHVNFAWFGHRNNIGWNNFQCRQLHFVQISSFFFGWYERILIIIATISVYLSCVFGEAFVLKYQTPCSFSNGWGIHITTISMAI